MPDLTANTKTTLGVAAGLALALIGAYVRIDGNAEAKVREAKAESAREIAKVAARVEVLETRSTNHALELALLKQNLDAMKETLKEIRDQLKSLTETGIRPARGRAPSPRRPSRPKRGRRRADCDRNLRTRCAGDASLLALYDSTDERQGRLSRRLRRTIQGAV